MNLPDISQASDSITLTREQYSFLLAKANGFELQKKCYEQIKTEILPTKEDLTLPWYEMLAKCVINRQLKPIGSQGSNP